MPPKSTKAFGSYLKMYVLYDCTGSFMSNYHYHVIILSTIACCSELLLRKYIRVVSMLSCPIKSAKREMSLNFSRKFLAKRCLKECG